jgi:hypothetical protein
MRTQRLDTQAIVVLGAAIFIAVLLAVVVLQQMI